MEKISGNEILKLMTSVLVCLFADFVGSYFTSPALSTWYASLEKPAFNPPDYLFFPVWTTLFILMGISLFLVWRKGLENKLVRSAVTIFAIQLGLNIMWLALFFGLRSPIAGLIEILILWAAILLTIKKFREISKAAALLLVPYILWVSFAAVLNFFLWRLNP